MSDPAKRPAAPSAAGGTSRRSVLGWGALLAGLGTCAAMGGGIVARFLLPPGRAALERRMYVGQLSDLPVGGSSSFLGPGGGRYLLTRTEGGVVAFSATCPHLGCKVHWEAAARRFFCPCHSGAFAADGSPIAGPPKDENTPLRALKLHVDGNAIYALVPQA